MDREQSDGILEWMTQERIMLLQDIEDSFNEISYHLFAYLNTFYKILTSIIVNYVKEHAERNNIL